MGKDIIAAALLLAATAAQAQPVWRCGNSYGTQPCAGGTQVAAPDRPQAGAAAQARAVAKADEQLADRLQRERLEREKDAPRAVIPPQPAASAIKDDGKKAGKDKGPQDFTAVAPGSPKTKEKKAK